MNTKIYIRIYKLTHTYIYTCIHTHAHTHTFIYINTHAVWDAIEWIGNTLIFVLAGLMFGSRLTSNLKAVNFVYLAVVYISIILVRFAMFAVVTPLLGMGHGMYVYMHVHMHHIYTHIYACIHTYTCIHTYIHTYIYRHTYKQI